MEFEEFFRKKKINLQTFEQGEPGLFSEFKLHFGKMGEKSFDHTKKYWFNKLRLRFPATVEVKVEKEIIENRLAEQTITESLVESSSPPPNIGFKPKFRAGSTKPAETIEPAKEEIQKPEATSSVTDSATEPPKPAIGFKPKFKAGVTKPAEPIPQSTELTKPEVSEEKTEPAAPALGFKPKFRAGITKPAEPVPEQKVEPTTEENTTPPSPQENQETKPVYKPRFNMNKIKPKEGE
jgi:hypothetical protein